MAKKEDEVEEAKKLEPITTNFGREDLNSLRDTLNEVIKHLK